MEKYKPTESELEILSILWERGASSVKEINDELNKKKEVGYTTTLKILQIMFEKNYVTREKVGRGHVYEASIKQEDTQEALLDKVLKTAFSGSASKLVMQLIGKEKTSQTEIDEIKKYLDSLEDKENGTK